MPSRFARRILLLVVLACAAAFAAVALSESAAALTPRPVGLLSWDKQLEVREGWLRKRHGMILPLLRRHGIGAWIVVSEEFH